MYPLFFLALFFASALGWNTPLTQAQKKLSEFEASKSPNPITAWPLDEDGKYTTIPFCYTNKATRFSVQDNFLAAWAYWRHALGGHSSKMTGHNLRLAEVTKWHTWQGTLLEPTYCRDASGKWNPHVPGDALEVKDGGQVSAGATIGYRWEGKKGRNMIKIPADKINLHAAVRQLGHALGLQLEHKRTDLSANFVKFTCANIVGYAEAQKKYTNSLSHDPEQLFDLDICDEGGGSIPKVYGFSQLSYFVPHYTLTTQWSDDVDWDSIMLGSSWDWAHKGCSKKTPHKCPLARMKSGPMRAEEEGVEVYFMDINHRPSTGDADWVKNTYPWRYPFEEMKQGDGAWD